MSVFSTVESSPCCINYIVDIDNLKTQFLLYRERARCLILILRLFSDEALLSLYFRVCRRRSPRHIAGTSSSARKIADTKVPIVVPRHARFLAFM